MRRWSAWIAPLALSWLVGCGPDLDVSTYQQRVIRAASPDEVFDAAAELMRREFGRVDLERAARRADSEPVEFDADRDSGLARDMVGASTRMRRLAHCMVTPRESDVLVYLRIDIERQDTARQTAMGEEAARADDRPGYTPVERDAATTEQQNTVWTRVRRDRTLEGALLDELVERFGGASEAPLATTQPAARPAAAESAPQ